MWLVVCAFLAVPIVSYADDDVKEKPKEEKKAEEAPKEESSPVDFSSEKTFLDVPDALRSKGYVERAVLSSTIKETSNFDFGRLYVDNLIGYDAIFQPANRGPFAKYSSGDLSFGLGYLSEGGNATELAVSLSAVSTISVSYRHIFRPKTYGFWPFVGIGLGMEVKPLGFTDVPIAAQAYTGSSEMIFPTVGVMIPLIDVGLKLEARFVFYGLSRLILTTGAGVVFFL